MPVRFTAPAVPPPAPMPRGSSTMHFRGEAAPEVAPAEESSGPGWGTAALGAGALGAGLIAHNPKAAWEGAKTAGRFLGSARQQLMLSGLAPLKSALGNIGATAIESAERGTMAPLKSLFSMNTLRDIKDIYKTGGQAAGQGALPGMGRAVGKAASEYGTTLPGPMPGRVMGALDEAARNALVRSGVGISPTEAEKIMFQAPLPERLGKALDNPIMRYLVPFRRTPFNQLIEGAKTFAPETARQGAVLGTSLGAGAVHGASTADERFPLSVGLGAAAASKYGLPYSMGALVGRTLAGGQGGGGLASTAVPVGEFGVESSVMDPLQLIQDPPAMKALRRLLGGE